MVGQGIKFYEFINQSFAADSAFMNSTYWKSILGNLTLLLCFLYCYSYEIFVTISIYALIAILAIRAIHFTVTSKYLFLIDLCYFVNLLVIFNYFFPLNEFLLYLGACLSFHISISVFLFRLPLNFASLNDFTAFFFHAIPGFIYLPLVVERKIDFNTIDYSLFCSRTSAITIVYFAFYYFFLFFLTYNHWKKSNLVNFYVLYSKAHPYDKDLKRMGDRRGGFLFYLTYLGINLLSLGLWSLVVYNLMLTLIIFLGFVGSGIVNTRNSKRKR